MLIRFLPFSAVVAPLVFAVACVEDVGTGKVVAAEADPAPVAKQEVEGVKLAIDTSRSKVHALGAKITAKHPIDFGSWEGTLTVANNELVGVDVTIDMNSLTSDAERLTSHLKKEDFFFVEKFPQATFHSTSVVAGGVDGATHKVSGALTLRGVTKNLSFPAKVVAKDGSVHATAEFVIDRQDFGVSYPGKADDLVQDNVVLTIDLTGGSK